MDPLVAGVAANPVLAVHVRVQPRLLVDLFAVAAELALLVSIFKYKLNLFIIGNLRLGAHLADVLEATLDFHPDQLAVRVHLRR
jgi:hypothetical protein